MLRPSLRVFLPLLCLGLAAAPLPSQQPTTSSAKEAEDTYWRGYKLFIGGDKAGAIKAFREASAAGNKPAAEMLEIMEKPPTPPSKASPKASSSANQTSNPDRWPWLKSVFWRAGLNRLSAAECSALNQHIEELINAALTVSAREAVSATPSSTGDVIKTTIDGDFEGWDGDTVFRLSNGQIWQQTEYGYEYTYNFMPDVLIYRTRSGAWKMKVDGIDTAIGVRRLR